MERLKKQIDFINEAEKLKTIKRQNITLDNLRPENSAEHSWHLAIMAMVLMEQSRTSDLDQFKVIKMLLIHDIVEISAGDTFLYDEDKREEAHENERIALEKLGAILPLDQGQELIELWNEFELGESEEARFARSLDALQPLLNRLITAPENHNPHGITNQKVMEKKSFIQNYTPKLWPIVEETVKQSVAKGLYE